jgi:DNA-directed RNA polymerase sigma subunit (sigma70/sigma32)
MNEDKDETIRDYLKQVNRVPPLTNRELQDLAEAVQAGGEADDLAPAGTVAGAATARAAEDIARSQAARKRLIEGNLRVVVAVAEDYRSPLHGELGKQSIPSRHPPITQPTCSSADRC